MNESSPISYENGLLYVVSSYYQSLFDIFRLMDPSNLTILKNILCTSTEGYNLTKHKEFLWAVENIGPVFFVTRRKNHPVKIVQDRPGEAANPFRVVPKAFWTERKKATLLLLLPVIQEHWFRSSGVSTLTSTSETTSSGFKSSYNVSKEKLGEVCFTAAWRVTFKIQYQYNPSDPLEPFVGMCSYPWSLKDKKGRKKLTQEFGGDKDSCKYSQFKGIWQNGKNHDQENHPWPFVYIQSLGIPYVKIFPFTVGMEICIGEGNQEMDNVESKLPKSDMSSAHSFGAPSKNTLFFFTQNPSDQGMSQCKHYFTGNLPHPLQFGVRNRGKGNYVMLESLEKIEDGKRKLKKRNGDIACVWEGR